VQPPREKDVGSNEKLTNDSHEAHMSLISDMSVIYEAHMSLMISYVAYEAHMSLM